MKWFKYAGANFGRMFFGLGLIYDPEIEFAIVVLFGPWCFMVGREKIVGSVKEIC